VLICSQQAFDSAGFTGQQSAESFRPRVKHQAGDTGLIVKQQFFNMTIKSFRSVDGCQEDSGDSSRRRCRVHPAEFRQSCAFPLEEIPGSFISPDQGSVSEAVGQCPVQERIRLNPGRVDSGAGKQGTGASGEE